MSTSETQTWCGRSWEGLVGRRSEAFAHAVAMEHATERNCHQVANEFLSFFETTGAELFRDEEDWIFFSFESPPDGVISALEGHIAIFSLTQALSGAKQAGRVDVHLVHTLGEMLASHLLDEEQEVRPLTSHARPILPP